MRNSVGLDAHMRDRSPARARQIISRSASSFGQLHTANADESVQHPTGTFGLGPRRRSNAHQTVPADKSKPEAAALMERVQSVSAKADALLTGAGRANERQELRNAIQGRAYPNERLLDLTERLARLENLLDEVAALGSLPTPSTSRTARTARTARTVASDSVPQGISTEGLARTARTFLAESSRQGGAEEVPRALSFRNEAPEPRKRIAAPPPATPLVGFTPRSAGRFIEVAPGGATPGVPGTPSMPVHLQGAYSPTAPAPSFLNRQPYSNVPAQAPYYPAPMGMFAPEATPRRGTPRVSSRGVRTSVGGNPYSGRGEVGGNLYSGRQKASATEYAISAEPARSYSAPRSQSVPRQMLSACPPPHGVLAQGYLVGPGAAGTQTPMVPLQPFMQAPRGSPMMNAGVATPSMPPPPSLLQPFSPASLLASFSAQDGVDSKLRRWLSEIPIGNGADRGWDDSQIAGIASFAQDRHLEHLNAEDIYRKYVEYQVDSAG